DIKATLAKTSEIFRKAYFSLKNLFPFWADESIIKLLRITPVYGEKAKLLDIEATLDKTEDRKKFREAYFALRILFPKVSPFHSSAISVSGSVLFAFEKLGITATPTFSFLASLCMGRMKPRHAYAIAGSLAVIFVIPVAFAYLAQPASAGTPAIPAGPDTGVAPQEAPTPAVAEAPKQAPEEETPQPESPPTEEVQMPVAIAPKESPAPQAPAIIEPPALERPVPVSAVPAVETPAPAAITIEAIEGDLSKGSFKEANRKITLLLSRTEETDMQKKLHKLRKAAFEGLYDRAEGIYERAGRYLKDGKRELGISQLEQIAPEVIEQAKAVALELANRRLVRKVDKLDARIKKRLLEDILDQADGLYENGQPGEAQKVLGRAKAIAEGLKGENKWERKVKEKALKKIEKLAERNEKALEKQTPEAPVVKKEDAPIIAEPAIQVEEVGAPAPDAADVSREEPEGETPTPATPPAKKAPIAVAVEVKKEEPLVSEAPAAREDAEEAPVVEAPAETAGEMPASEAAPTVVEVPAADAEQEVAVPAEAAAVQPDQVPAAEEEPSIEEVLAMLPSGISKSEDLKKALEDAKENNPEAIRKVIADMREIIKFIKKGEFKLEHHPGLTSDDEAVKQLEAALKVLGYFEKGDVDERFEWDTKLELEKFQRDSKLAVTGIVDEATLKQLFKALLFKAQVVEYLRQARER
ncbi:peptidoglycan-binding protein, partial [Candidatus Omnitrophota bacterium]